MIKITIGIIICVIGLIVYYVIVNRRLLYQKLEAHIHNFTEEQKLYNNNRNKQKSLSQDEALEVSWQFLYYIADVVLKKFSRQDRDAVHDLGQQLAKTGMVYNHVIEYKVEKKKTVSKALSDKTEQRSQQQKSVS